MNLRNLASALSRLDNEYLYVQCPIMDFTNKKPVSMIVHDDKKKIEITLDRNELQGIIKTLGLCVFTPGRLILGWDVKEYFSYVQYYTKKIINYGQIYEENSEKIKRPVILDLRILESYSGINLPAPKTYAEAVKRLGNLKPITFSEIYNKIHVPLFQEVVPTMETVGIMDGKQQLHAHYEIEGQSGGRMKCSSLFEKSYNPHTMSKDKRGDYTSPFMDDVFVTFDYQALEVRVVQWLSQDPVLAEMLEGDVYFNIHKAIIGPEVNRNFAKTLFLSVIFGIGPKTLSENLKITIEKAAELIDKIQKTFERVFSYLKTQEDLIKNGMAVDHFGRKRSIEVGKEYIVRNFSIQSPAATVCLAKLVDLYKSLKSENSANLAFYIHDAYGIFVKEQSCQRIIQKIIKVLEIEHPLFPELKLKVSCKVGFNLNNMMQVNPGG